MDNSRGTPASTIDFSPVGSERNNPQGEFLNDSLGSPMRRLECDMGLPQGFLAIHERHGRQEERREPRREQQPQFHHESHQDPRSQGRRSVPAPYYGGDQEYRQQTMPGRFRFQQN